MALTDWTDPWACGACTYQHIEPAAARLAACSICGTRRPVGSETAAAPPGSKRPAARGPRGGLDHDGDAASAKRLRIDAPAPPAMAMPPAAEAAPAAAGGQLQPPAPASAATLRQLVALLAAHEPDLKDLLLGLCKPRYVAAHKRELPPHPEGPMGTFAVTVPEGTKVIEPHAFEGCASLAEITLPPALAAIGGRAFLGCTALAEITLPPQFVAIGLHAFNGCPGTPRRHTPAAQPL